MPQSTAKKKYLHKIGCLCLGSIIYFLCIASRRLKNDIKICCYSNNTHSTSLLEDQHLLFTSIILTTIFCLLCVPDSQGHLPSSRGMRDDYLDRSDHRKPVLPGECCPAEQVQGARPGEALSGGDVVDPGQSFGGVGDQSLGARSSARQRSGPSSWRRVSACPGDPALTDACHDLVLPSHSQSIGLTGRSGLCCTLREIINGMEWFLSSQTRAEGIGARAFLSPLIFCQMLKEKNLQEL